MEGSPYVPLCSSQLPRVRVDHENHNVGFVEGIARQIAKFHIAAMFECEVLGFSDSQKCLQNFLSG